MTKIAIVPNASGTGTFTIEAPNSNSNRTLVLPDAAGTVFLSDGAGTIQPTNVSDGTLSIPTTFVTNGSAKAWLNMNGTGTIAIRDSFNLSGLVDDGTGAYSFNLTNAFASSNYVPHGSGFRAGVGFAFVDYGVSSASSISVLSADSTGSFADISDIKGSAFGDLA
jgi:hypothetical protein